jgi:hypothetical protein
VVFITEKGSVLDKAGIEAEEKVEHLVPSIVNVDVNV